MRWPIPPERLAALLGGGTLIIHNAPFDCAWLKAKFGIRPPRVFDTLVAERILTNGLSLSNALGPTLERELGLTIPKELGASGDLFSAERSQLKVKTE
jgi:ribonuclease D